MYRAVELTIGRQVSPLVRILSAFVQVLPGVFDVPRAAPDEQRREVIVQIAGNRHLAPVQGGIAQPVRSVEVIEKGRSRIGAPLHCCDDQSRKP